MWICGPMWTFLLISDYFRFNECNISRKMKFYLDIGVIIIINYYYEK